MIKTIPPKGPSIFITNKMDTDVLETYLTNKSYAKFDDIIMGQLGTHYVFENLNEDVDSIVAQYLKDQENK